MIPLILARVKNNPQIPISGLVQPLGTRPSDPPPCLQKMQDIPLDQPHRSRYHAHVQPPP